MPMINSVSFLVRVKCSKLFADAWRVRRVPVVLRTILYFKFVTFLIDSLTKRIDGQLAFSLSVRVCAPLDPRTLLG